MKFQLKDNTWWVTDVEPPNRSAPEAGERPSGNDRNKQLGKSIEVIFAPEGRDNSPMTDDEISLVRWFVDNREKVYEAALAAIFSEYPKIIDSYCGAIDDLHQSMPNVKSVEGLSSLINLRSIFIHQISPDGIPYVGFEFDCTWDAEHGLGVLVHGARIVDIAGADIAFVLWMAEEDAERWLA